VSAGPSANERITVRTLTDGGQTPLDVAKEIAAFLGAAERTLDIALYDLELGAECGAIVTSAIRAAVDRGAAVRLVYNIDHDKPIPVPPPPRTNDQLLAALAVPSQAIPGVPDLMHHKYVVRDGRHVLTGSTNWTEDSWSREENVIVTVDSPEIASDYGKDFEQIWATREVARSGDVEPRKVDLGNASARAWFCPDRGAEVAHRIATAIGDARRRIRICSPVITSGPVLGTLAEVAADGKVDLAGVVDATQIEEVYGQWRGKEGTRWKLASLGQVFAAADFTGKVSTPYRPGSVHDYMHAKMTVADDVSFIGSFNLSHSGELNAENVLELRDPELADRIAKFIDQVRSRYPRAPLPSSDSAPGARRHGG
jgi:phosphatidylserine/phosphatidylglycerophosphate/cardiolipin synthase-like enzyme